MVLDWSNDLTSVVDESRDVADQLGHDLTSAHLLLCIFMVENQASEFLSDHSVTADRLLTLVRRQPKESPDAWAAIMQRAHDTALVTGAPYVGSLHVLIALCSIVDSQAYALISALDLDMGTVRARALSHLTGPQELDGDVEHPPEREIQFEHVHAPATHRQPRPQAAAAATMTTVNEAGNEDEEDTAERKNASGLREPADVRRRRKARFPAAKRPAPSDTTRDLARRLFDGREPGTKSGSRPAVVAPSNLPLPPSVRRSTGSSPAVVPNEPAPKDGPSATPGPAARRPATVAKQTPTVRRVDLVLKEREFPLLSKLGRNLSLLAFDGLIDDVVGRDAEIEQLIDILNKRRSNNPLLVGEAGVGKTSVVEGLARRMVGRSDAPAPSGLTGRVLIELESSKVVSGTGIRGSFSERIQRLKTEVARAKGRVVVFMDELHHWIGMGSGDGAADGAGELKTALARGEFPCIGATTFDEYAKFVEGDPAFARRFQRVRVEEPSASDAVRILEGIRPTYEAHHGVTYELDALDAAVRLTHRYLPDRRLPDKAISVLDLAGSRAQRRASASQPGNVDRSLVATIVAELAGVSADKLLLGDRERFVGLADNLGQHIVGHDDVRERVAHALRRNYAGFVSGRPIGTFLFLGPTGVGKTEFAKAIARVLFEDESAMLRLDMSEFMEAHAVARLIGAPPGSVGHDAGGQLTESVRRKPYQLVLFDEIEKAHPDVLNLLIQLLDEGRLTDSRSRTVDFSNTVVVMTSNLGAEAAFAAPKSRRVGFGTTAEEAPETGREQAVLDSARGHFRAELWNRIQERLVFLPLAEDHVRRIASLQLEDSSRRLLGERRIRYEWSDEVVDLLIESGGFDPEFGARPMRRTIERIVEGAIADSILSGEARAGDTLDVSVVDDRVRVVKREA